MSEPPQRVSFPRGVWAVMAVALGVQFAVFGALLALQADQRRIVNEQLRNSDRQLREALPLVRDARPIAEEQREQLPRTGRLVSRSLALTREARPLVDALNAARVGDQLQAVGALARALVSNDVGRVVRAGAQVSDELLAQSRLRRLLVRANTVLGDARAHRLVEKVARATDLVPELVSLQRRALAAAVQTLEVAREAERHAESLDQKFGGETSGPPATR